ncbi:MAG TPA: hypothetical protein EYG73_12705 [Arcobacter sp.]|nr:hypothetical protein [Arcobacter sp.]
MKFNSNVVFVIVMFLFAITVIYRNDVEKNRVDISSYHFDVNDTVRYLLKEESIYVYNTSKNTLGKIHFYNSPKGILFEEAYFLNIPKNNLDKSSQSTKYTKGLSTLSCKEENISICLDSNIKSNINYVQKDGTKYTILKNDFASKLYENVNDYQEYLNKEKQN